MSLSEPHTYEGRIAVALERYESVIGRRPSPELFDRGREEVRAAYARFLQRPFELAPGASLGERMALRLGLKPVLRELVAPARVAALRDEFRAMGCSVAVVGERVDEDATTGLVAEQGGARQRVVVHAGRNAEQVERAAELDQVLLADVSRGVWEDATHELGRVLGYPDCCVEAFVALGPFEHNRTPIAAAAANSDRFDPLLNNLSLSFYRHIAWYPCRYDCPASLKVARQVAQHLRTSRPGAFREVQRVLSMPRVYADERRQLLFSGARVAADEMRFQEIFTPYALDGEASEAAFEWLWYCDVVVPLLEAGRIGLSEGALSERSGEDWVWLPFGVSGEPG